MLQLVGRKGGVVLMHVGGGLLVYVGAVCFYADFRRLAERVGEGGGLGDSG